MYHFLDQFPKVRASDGAPLRNPLVLQVTTLRQLQRLQKLLRTAQLPGLVK